MSSFKYDDTKLLEIRTMLTNTFAENYARVRISSIIISWPSLCSSPVSPHFQIFFLQRVIHKQTDLSAAPRVLPALTANESR